MTQPRSDLHAEIATLRNENAALKEKVRHLEDAYATLPWPEAWKLQPHQQRLLSAIYHAAPAILSRERCHESLGNDLFIPESDPNMVRVAIHMIRRKLAPLDVSIKTHWGQGYSISAADKAKLKAMVSG